MMFEEYYQKYLTIGSDIPEQQRQKLNFLLFSIKNHENDEIEINPENYPNLEVEEIEALFRLPTEAQKSMFCSVFKSLEMEGDSKVQGELHVKGETLGIWRIKKLELNLTHKKLSIPRKEGIVELHLPKYGILWIGLKKSKSTYFCFMLMANNPAIYDHYKQLILGSDEEEYAKKWFHLMQGQCDTKPEPVQPRRMSVEYNKQSAASPPLNKSDQFDLSKSDNYSESWLSSSKPLGKKMQKIAEQPESPDPHKQQTFELLHPERNCNKNTQPEYLNDMTMDKFKEGEFYRCGKNVYKSVSKKNLYQVQVELDHPLETVLYFLYLGFGFNRYITNEWSMVEYSNYKIVDQKRQMYYFGLPKEQQLYIMRYKTNDTVIEKQLNSLEPQYSIAKLFKRQQVILQILCQLTGNFLQDSHNIQFMEQYHNLSDHINYVTSFRDMYFEPINLLTSSSISHHSEDIFTEKFEQSTELFERIPNNLFDLLEFVQLNKHWAVALNREFQLSPISVEPKFLKSNTTGNFLLKNYWKIDHNQGGLLYVDENGLKEQKKVFSYLLSQIGTNLASGKSIMSISLPVYVFEKQSNLQRYASSLTYLQYLDKSVGKDWLAQFKNFLPYGYGTVILYLNMWKPFNPILGETYQGFINGCPIYAEQVSHHPPISNLLIYGNGYRVNHRLCTIANISANSVSGINQGYTKIYYKDTDSEFIYLPCSGTYTGTIYGDKLFQMVGKFHLLDLKHKYVAEVKLNPYPGSMWKRRREHLDDYFEGYIYQVNDDCIRRFKKDGYLKFKELHPNEIVNQLSKIHGIWHKDMYIDNEEVWNINTEPYVLEDEEFPLASDSNFREDLIAWKTTNFDLAMRMKTKMEEAQRADAKLRKKH